VKDSSSSPWEARNVGDISVEGLDFSGNFFEINKFIKRAGMSYTYLNLKEKNPCSFSKYVSDYNRHKIVTNLGFAAGGFTIDTDINSNFPRLRKGYTTVDIRIQRQLGRFNISLEGLNVFNKSYEDAQDIEASGRWCKINCAYSF
jgi:outer membrane receptor for ferrienterochelin and colicin